MSAERDEADLDGADLDRADLDGADLELSLESMRAMTDATVTRVLAHLASLEAQPARGELGDALQRCAEMREPPPEHGCEIDALLAPLFDDWIGRSYNTASPGYLAYVPGGGLYPAALADFVANAVNRYTGVWNAAPLLVQLEANVLDWLRASLGFPEGARGLLTTGGSMATFSAVVTAREKLLGERIRDGVIYVSDQVHACVAKAARLSGVLDDRVRRLPCDSQLRLDVGALEVAIAADRARGLLPFFVASSAGTVNTGTVDAIDAIADVAQREGLWHHCDGAYGGFFYLCPELRETLRGISRADSLTLDPHKGLFLPYGTGALLVRDGEALRAAHAWSADYVPPLPGDDVYNPCQYGPELSRDFRGLRLWLPLKLYGLARFRAALTEKHQLARWAAQALAEIEGIEVLGPPALSLFAFRVVDGHGDQTRANAATRALLERVIADGRVFLSGTEIDGVAYARVCILSFRTRRRHVEALVDAVRRARYQAPAAAR